MRFLLGQWTVAVLAMTTIHTSVAEFVEIQGLSRPELRERFELPDACEPSMAAMHTRREQVTVLISCDLADEDDQDGSS